MSIKLSIVMPCFNSEDTIKESIDSIVNLQINCTYEIIILDDGSTDKTLKYLEKYKSSYSNIKVLKNITNQGEGYSRNKCISSCSGEIIGYLDSDNLFDHDCVNNMI
tara:strand:- start:806 stop:1126 length:321 start_codon:yes stop_codon:yes gene_type:complete